MKMSVQNGYRQTFTIRLSLAGYKIGYYLDVIGASPLGAALILEILRYLWPFTCIQRCGDGYDRSLKMTSLATIFQQHFISTEHIYWTGLC